MSTPAKRCSTCHEIRPLTEFNVRRRAADGRQARCRACARAWYAANRTEHIRNVRRVAVATNARYRDRLAAYFASHPCVDCGQDDIRCLEFDHRDGSGKLADVATLMQSRAAWHRIEAEIAKCDVRCANCHRKVTAERARSWRAVRHAERSSADRQAAVDRLRAVAASRPAG